MCKYFSFIYTSSVLDSSNFPNQKPKHYTSVKARTDSGLRSNNNKIKRDKNIFKTDDGLIRSLSALDLQLRFDDILVTSSSFQLRRSNSTSVLEVKDKQRLDISNIETRLTTSNQNNEKIKHKNNFKNRNHASPSEVGKIPKPILRKARTSPVKPNTLEESNSQSTPPNVITDTGRTNQNVNHRVHVETTSSPSKETTINGIPLSKLPRQKQRRLRNGRERNVKIKTKSSNTGVNSATTATSNLAESPKKSAISSPCSNEKTLEECEREGARNFARCLLGILPSVLGATEPWTADELLQQFSSDVCEAVTCLALKRKNVPDFGTVRRLHVKKDGEENNYGVVDDPTLNADGVYKAVYETLKLNYELITSDYYRKPGSVPHISQVRWKCGFYRRTIFLGLHDFEKFYFSKIYIWCMDTVDIRLSAQHLLSTPLE